MQLLVVWDMFFGILGGAYYCTFKQFSWNQYFLPDSQKNNLFWWKSDQFWPSKDPVSWYLTKFTILEFFWPKMMSGVGTCRAFQATTAKTGSKHKNRDISLVLNFGAPDFGYVVNWGNFHLKTHSKPIHSGEHIDFWPRAWNPLFGHFRPYGPKNGSISKKFWAQNQVLPLAQLWF